MWDSVLFSLPFYCNGFHYAHKLYVIAVGTQHRKPAVYFVRQITFNNRGWRQEVGIYKVKVYINGSTYNSKWEEYYELGVVLTRDETRSPVKCNTKQHKQASNEQSGVLWAALEDYKVAWGSGVPTYYDGTAQHQRCSRYADDAMHDADSFHSQEVSDEDVVHHETAASQGRR